MTTVVDLAQAILRRQYATTPNGTSFTTSINWRSDSEVAPYRGRTLPNVSLHTQASAFFKSTLPPQDVYAILGVTKHSTQRECIRAYRRRMMDAHPDRHPEANDAERAVLNAWTRALNKAFDTLCR